jgi:3-phenylpropionate/cinnamic acid dioxygenase small subunit
MQETLFEALESSELHINMLASQVDEKTAKECENFLYREARLLDNWRLRDWLALVSEDIDYRIPIRVTRETTAGPGFSDSTFNMLEDWPSLKARVARLEHEYAWAEDPPSRTRRFVTNVVATGKTDDGRVHLESYLMLFRSKADQLTFELISCERQDLLRNDGGQWKLSKRLVLLDHTVVPSRYLSVIL